MKIIRFESEDGQVYLGTQVSEQEASILEGDLFAEYRIGARRAKIRRLLAPIEPVDILCIGLNYRKHAAEGNQPIPEFPVLFMKNLGTVQNPGGDIVLPRKLKSESVDYECELAVVIGKRCHNVSKSQALDYVLGYTCANDVSARDWQMKYGGSQWCRGKTFATFCPLGPCLVTKDEIPNPNALGIRQF